MFDRPELTLAYLNLRSKQSLISVKYKLFQAEACIGLNLVFTVFRLYLIRISNTVLFDDFLYNKKKSMKILLEFSGLFHCSVIKVLT